MNSIVAEKKWISQNLENAGQPIRYENLSQSYLRAETLLSTNASIEFVLQQNKTNSTIPTERLLSLNDQFVLTHITVGLKQIGADAPTVTQHQNADIYSYDNPNVFTGTNAQNVSAIYNGSLSFNIDRKDFIPEFPARAFRRVPETQSGSTLTATGGDTATFGANGSIDAWPNGLFAFYPVDPTLIDGRQTLEVSIDLGGSLPFDDSSNSIYAVFEARGYLLVNAKD
jgi:hypothetical protein